MAITFPASPDDGDVFTNTTTGVKYIYNATDGVWKTHVWPTNTDYLQLSGGTLTGDLSLGTNDLTAQDITATGSVTVGNGLTVSDGNVVMAAGHGIDFSATADSSGTMTSELLDDYEEGTFTPVLIGGTTAGSYTPESQLGLYTKIGRTVTVHLALVNITVTTNGTGSMLISGFPFTSSSIDKANFTGSVRFDRVDFSTPTKYVVAVMSQSQSRIGFQEVRDDDGDSGVTVASGILQSGASDIFVSISYIVD